MLKLAVPTRAGEVDEHFGHCESFTIYSIDDNKAVIGQERFTPPPSCGCKSNLIPTLVEMGVKVLVAGNMGQGAVTRLGAAGIQVFPRAKGDVAEAVQAWLTARSPTARCSAPPTATGTSATTAKASKACFQELNVVAWRGKSLFEARECTHAVQPWTKIGSRRRPGGKRSL